MGTLNVAGNITGANLNSFGYVGIGITASSVLELQNINYPTFK